ncbi:hypothetical protein FDI40_gp392 [Agrobacterium phage Atu_ph07]|uniref:Uncharacterized protein n=1 Tax=Agrobacterium phage Atu_ph07 TaxID=2024264 RepID=A0A2L0V054_9CAUD|nr:hypothetical protein FDI40_gp392 [Agrobacterium phage Atu_ph07]AUZ95151.1 hypothetical protein [Agrobacterium phage Atu_ph07]
MPYQFQSFISILKKDTGEKQINSVSVTIPQITTWSDMFDQPVLRSFR